nr:hypothetical protein [Tanacetum cinerariifolium]
MQNNIMAAGSRDRPPMLSPGRYAQWQSRQPITDESSEVPKQTAVKTFSNISPKNKAYYDAEKEAIHLLLTGIGDEICSTADAFTSRDGESIESYYSRFYKMRNGMTGQFGNQMIVTVAGARETIGNQITYHKEKRLLCKQAEKGVPLQAEQADWLEDTNKEIYEQELKAHYSLTAKIQEVLPAKSGSNAEPLEKDDSNIILDSPNMCDNDNHANQNAEECDDECVVLANLIANLKLDTNENKKIQKQLKKANTTLSHELQECKSALKECKSSLEKSNRTQDRYLGLLAQKEHDIQEGLKIKAYEVSVVKEKNDELVKHSLLTKLSYESVVKAKNKVIKDLKLKEERNIEKLIAMEKQLKFLNEIVYKQNQSIQTIHMLALKGSTYNGRPTFANPMYLKKAQSEKPCLYEIPCNKCDLANLFSLDRVETLTLEPKSILKLNTDLVKPYDYTKQNSLMKFLNHRHGNILISCNM